MGTGEWLMRTQEAFWGTGESLMGTQEWRLGR